MFLTNGSGIFGPNIAEHVIGMMLAFNGGCTLPAIQHSASGVGMSPTHSVSLPIQLSEF